MKENQFNNLINELTLGCENLSTFTFDLFLTEGKYKELNESIGVPNFINTLTSNVLTTIQEAYNNNENEIQIELIGELEGWKINVVFSRNQPLGFTYKDEKTILININNLSTFDITFYSNIVGHELMHAYQLTLSKKHINQDKYEKMNILFDNVEEWNPLCILNYIIYYSFTEEQEAYTVGGKEYFDNIKYKHDMEYNEYVSILRNSPYHLVFNRLGRARTILLNKEFYIEEINAFCEYYNITEQEVLKMLDGEIKTFKYKFSRVINNFCMQNNISMKDRKKFYF